MFAQVHPNEKFLPMILSCDPDGSDGDSDGDTGDTDGGHGSDGDGNWEGS